MTAPTAPYSTSIPATASAAVGSGDRLTFTVFIAIAFHALLIFGLTFNVDFGQTPAPTLEITLATHNNKAAPEKADYLAQFNQEASGVGDKAQQMTTDQRAEINDSRIQEINPQPQIQARTPTEKSQMQLVATSAKSERQTLEQPKQDPQAQEDELRGKDPQTTPLSSEIASLQAKLDEQRQAIAKRPRIRRITSVATKASADAAYIGKWQQKIEFVGNSNFPEEAIRSKIFGKLRLATTLKPNGTIHSVEILQSSGQRILDEAALQIVHLSSPFSPFPADIRSEVDLLEIIRTWHFEIDGLSTSNL